MRPALKAGLQPRWRDRDTLQFGVDPRRATAVAGLGQTAAVLSLTGAPLGDDGFYSIRLEGTVGELRRLGQACH